MCRTVTLVVPRAEEGKEWDLNTRIDLAGGKQLRYEGGEALYEGAFGVIFPCKLRLGIRDQCKEIDAVVKCEKKVRNNEEEYEKKLEKLEKLKKIPPHDNLVEFYGGKILGSNDSAHFGALLVFEKIDCNLKELMFEEKTFAEICTYGDLVKIVLQVVPGLLHLLDSGVLHKDHKLQNLLVSTGPGDDLSAKILDFGESKAINDTKYSVEGVCSKTEEILSTLEDVKKHESLSQEEQTKVAEHHTPAATEDHPEEEANGINPAAESSSEEREEILFESSENTIVRESVVEIGASHPTVAKGSARNSKISFKGKSIKVTNSVVAIRPQDRSGDEHDNYPEGSPSE